MAKNVTVGNKTYIGINKIKVKIPETETYHEFFETEDGTATENDIVSGKTAYASNRKVIGTLEGGGGFTQEDLDNAYDSGYNIGESDGYTSGLQDGYYDGYQEGKSEGDAEGYSRGYDDGYYDGYNDMPAVCFVKGTKITLADGTTKNVEDITYDDKLLTWNFDEGKQDHANIFWIAKESKASTYWEVIFSDNTTLCLVGAEEKSHRLFNLEQCKFAYPQDFNEGEHTIKEDGSLVTITSCIEKQEEVTYYNLLTFMRLNNYANGILTGCRFTNIYPIQDMKYVKDDRPLIAREEYKEIPDKYFDGLRLAEQPIDTQQGDVNYFATTKEMVINNVILRAKNYE